MGATDRRAEPRNPTVQCDGTTPYLEDDGRLSFPVASAALPLQNLLAQAGGQLTLPRLGLPGPSEHLNEQALPSKLRGAELASMSLVTDLLSRGKDLCLLASPLTRPTCLSHCQQGH